MNRCPHCGWFLVEDIGSFVRYLNQLFADRSDLTYVIIPHEPVEPADRHPNVYGVNISAVMPDDARIQSYLYVMIKDRKIYAKMSIFGDMKTKGYQYFRNLEEMVDFVDVEIRTQAIKLATAKPSEPS